MVSLFFMGDILNLTQHVATESQVAAGVVEPNSSDKDTIKSLLTFDEIPKREWMIERAEMLTKLIHKNGFKKAMIGGAPFFMSILENTLKKSGIQPLYAFSKREVVETTDARDHTVKTVVFKHLGFVSP